MTGHSYTARFLKAMMCIGVLAIAGWTSPPATPSGSCSTTVTVHTFTYWNLEGLCHQNTVTEHEQCSDGSETITQTYHDTCESLIG